MSDRQLAKELQARNVLAERIAAVLRQRHQEVGAERRTHEFEYQRLNNDRALARYYRLRGGAVAQQVDGITGHSKSVSRAVRDVHPNKVAERAVEPYVVHFHWNSVNGSTADHP
jgi:hypothetical protein